MALLATRRVISPRWYGTRPSAPASRLSVDPISGTSTSHATRSSREPLSSRRSASGSRNAQRLATVGVAFIGVAGFSDSFPVRPRWRSLRRSCASRVQLDMSDCAPCSSKTSSTSVTGRTSNTGGPVDRVPCQVAHLRTTTLHPTTAPHCHHPAIPRPSPSAGTGRRRHIRRLHRSVASTGVAGF